jgi:hypothetical protein
MEIASIPTGCATAVTDGLLAAAGLFYLVTLPADGNFVMFVLFETELPESVCHSFPTIPSLRVFIENA